MDLSFDDDDDNNNNEKKRFFFFFKFRVLFGINGERQKLQGEGNKKGKAFSKPQFYFFIVSGFDIVQNLEEKKNWKRFPEIKGSNKN